MSERQIKKHIHGQAQSLRVDYGPGWGSVALDELKDVLNRPLQNYKFQPKCMESDDGIIVENLDFRQLLELPLRLLTPSEIFWQIGTRHVGSFGEYEAFLRSIDWSLYLPPKARIKVRSYSYRSPLYHEGKLDKIARDILHASGFTDKDYEYILRIEQKENRCTAYLALTPEPLFRRHYKSDLSHPAPLQEHLAASSVRWAAQESVPDYIAVPFAGSGTLIMESWLHFHRPPLDLWRKFICLEQLPEFPESSWAFIKKKLLAETATLPARGIEIDRQGSEILRKNLTHAETHWSAMQGQWEISCQDFQKDQIPVDRKSIFIPLNPPYGLRLEEDTRGIYRNLGRWLMTGFQSDQRRFGFVLVADSKAFHAFEQEIGSESIKGIQSFTQGGQHIRCVRFDIAAKV